MKKLALRLYDAYKYIFDSSRNPLRHIPDPVSRMFIMIILAFMWSGTFAIYLGSITYFGISLAAHIVLLLMFFFTMAVFYDAEKNNSSWLLRLRKQKLTQKTKVCCGSPRFFAARPALIAVDGNVRATVGTFANPRRSASQQ